MVEVESKIKSDFIKALLSISLSASPSDMHLSDTNTITFIELPSLLHGESLKTEIKHCYYRGVTGIPHCTLQIIR